MDAPLLQQGQQRLGPDLKGVAADAPFLFGPEAHRPAAVDQYMRSLRRGDQDAVTLAHIQIANGPLTTTQVLRIIASVQQKRHSGSA
ncbi:hypothetical protein D3C74_367330 [compost metagenome]